MKTKLPNWPKVIAELAAHHGTQRAVASALEISTTIVNELATGVRADPRYSIGHKIVEAHRALKA